jgi:hypothetical protein
LTQSKAPPPAEWKLDKQAAQIGYFRADLPQVNRLCDGRTPSLEEGNDEEDEEDDEKDLRDVRSGSHDPRETEDAGDEGDDEEGDGPGEHVWFSFLVEVQPRFADPELFDRIREDPDPIPTSA